jgi:hypothetical protein
MEKVYAPRCRLDVERKKSALTLSSVRADRNLETDSRRDLPPAQSISKYVDVEETAPVAYPSATKRAR